MLPVKVILVPGAKKLPLSVKFPLTLNPERAFTLPVIVRLLKVIPLPLHGLIEFVVGVALIVIAFTILKNDVVGKSFYTYFGAAVLFVFLFTDYKQEG